MKIKVDAWSLLGGKEIKSYIYEAKELGNNTPYGGGQYISVMTDGDMQTCIDCRYMKGYNLKDAAFDYLKAYYGENLADIEVIEE